MHYRFLSGPLIVAEQGHIMGRPGTARIEVMGHGRGDRLRQGRGTAVTVMASGLFLPCAVEWGNSSPDGSWTEGDLVSLPSSF